MDVTVWSYQASVTKARTPRFYIFSVGVFMVHACLGWNLDTSFHC